MHDNLFIEVDRDVVIDANFVAKDLCRYERLRIFYDIDVKRIVIKEKDTSEPLITEKRNDIFLWKLMEQNYGKKRLLYKQLRKNGSTYKYYNYLGKHRLRQSITSKIQNHCNCVRAEKIDDFINFVKRRSAIKIQNQWKTSICDPEYKLCQNRIFNEFDDLKMIL